MDENSINKQNIINIYKFPKEILPLWLFMKRNNNYEDNYYRQTELFSNHFSNPTTRFISIFFYKLVAK